jgi:biotin synthase-like enzyme
VIEELRAVKEEGYRFVRFMDDLFILSPDWVEEFAERYRREIRLPFSCLVRPNLVTDRTMKCLREAGCHRVLMGVEAGNDRLRTEVLKRRMSREQILEAARTVREAGLKLVTANILGIPGGSFEADWETLDLNLRARPHYASVSLMQAYPGTEIHEHAESLGLVEADQMQRVSRARAFGFTSELRFTDQREKERVENLHKLFPWVVWLPFLAPLIRRLVELRPNRIFDFLYLISLNLGSSLVMVPPRIGGAILWRKVLDRLRAPGWATGTTRAETT